VVVLRRLRMMNLTMMLRERPKNNKQLKSVQKHHGQHTSRLKSNAQKRSGRNRNKQVVLERRQHLQKLSENDERRRRLLWKLRLSGNGDKRLSGWKKRQNEGSRQQTRASVDRRMFFQSMLLAYLGIEGPLCAEVPKRIVICRLQVDHLIANVVRML